MALCNHVRTQKDREKRKTIKICARKKYSFLQGAGKEKGSTDSADEQKSWVIAELDFKAHSDMAETYRPKEATVPGLWDVSSTVLPITWEFLSFTKQL